MDNDIEISDKNDLNQATGQYDYERDSRIIVYPIDKYELLVKLSPTNEFLGIEGITINKDFLSYKQKIGSQGGHDVEQFYQE